MPKPAANRESTADAALGNRLDCWKEIAAYLGRGERTVKRWESERGLPTHRAPGAGRTAVYAYTAELDEWLKLGKAQGLDTAEPKSALAEGDENQSSPALEKDLPPTAEPAPLIPAQSAAQPAAAQPIPLVTPSPTGVRGVKLAWRVVFAGMLAAGAVGAIIYATILRPVAGGILRGAPAIFGKAKPVPNQPSALPVSDQDKALANDLYLKGRYEWNQRTPDSLNSALDDFTQAVVHDPNDAKSYVGLADTYDLLREYSTMPENDAFQRAIAAARRAVQLDDSLAVAHRALAFAEFYGAWDYADSEKEFRRAIQLDPKDPVTRRWYANAFAVPGRFTEALDQIDMAQELDPTSPATLSDKGIMLFQAGRREEGIALLKEVEHTVPGFRSPHFYLMVVSMELRQYQAYLDEGQKAAESMNDPMMKDIIASARAGYARAGERGLLHDLYAKQKEYYSAGKLSATMLAKTCVMMGRKQEALQLLEESYARHEEYVLSCLVQPDLLTLKDEPRYKELVKKINFPPAPGRASASPVSAAEMTPLRTDLQLNREIDAMLNANQN